MRPQIVSCLRRAAIMSPLAAMILAGCQTQEAPTYYTGPTLSLDELVARVNANNSQIPTLWTRQNFDAKLIDNKGNVTSVATNGVILYRAPHELLITGNDEFGTAFEMGANAEFYWLKVVQGQDTLWWGRMRNAGKPCVKTIPIRPDLILDVLAVGVTDPNLMHQPMPLMRFNNDADAYMVDSVVSGADRLVVQKEVWYDRATLLPGLVLLFDANGRAVLQAHLSDYVPLVVDGVPEDRRPRIATIYKLLLLDSASRLEFTLHDQVVSKNGIPHAGSVHLPDLANPGVKNVVQVDAACDAQ